MSSEREAVRAALERAQTALNDWLHQYAGEFCNEDDVLASGRRILDEGGTLAYIADVQAEIIRALNLFARPLSHDKEAEGK